MARFRNYLLVVIGFAVAGMIGAALGTGTAQAVVSTLVSVVNPNTSPVQTLSVTDPGRIAYQSEADLSGNCSASTFCGFVFPAVPAGHRVVVQHITGLVTFGVAPTVITVTTSSGATLVSNFYGPIPPGILSSQFDLPALFYVDASKAADVTVRLVGNGSTFGGGTEQVTLTGYELDCTVAACAPIAQ